MTEHKPHTFVVAIDGSPSSTQAFHYAMEHSQPEDKIVLATGVHQKQLFMSPDLIKDPSKIPAQMERNDLDNQYNLEKAKDMLLRFQNECQKVHKRNCSTQPIQFAGGASAVGESLCQFAESHRATLVMGSRGLSQLERVLLGSISDYCVRNCNATVTVVKGPSK